MLSFHLAASWEWATEPEVRHQSCGYRVGVTEDQLKGAPKYNRNSEWDWSDRSRDKVISDYYRAPLWYA